MRLEIGSVQVQEVCFGTRTGLKDHTLVVDRGELGALLEEDPQFDRVEVELAHPGESCRVIHVLDVLEPRYRLVGPNFPGALDPMGLVGQGHTRALKNVVVVETSQMAGVTGVISGELIDLTGPATAYTPFGSMHNLVLLPHPAQGADPEEYRLAVKRAGLRAAVYLAEAAKAATPDETQVYELPAVAENQERLRRLPRVAYIFPIHSHQRPTHQRETVFYGSNIQGFMPTIVHPNEILDGALMFAFSAFTYHAQNQPVILELFRRHGRDLWFAGVVLTLAPATIFDKERNAYLAARLAKDVLAAEGVLATKIGGGAVDTDLMLIYQRCEELGMQAALIIMERYPDTGLTFVAPGVNALVSPGLTRDPIDLPAMERVIGGDTVVLDPTDPSIPPAPASGPLRLWVGDIAGAISQVGASRLTTYMS